ncbi:hypothetical protein IVA98_08630 [Bradyrhizobium sp. 160]|uniref:hypothetical protein n=1 Tax=Bradyrhizobium sp. 160 TaxID=2782634 RepID=UPI001FFC160A|nr:hypothetical protein [Bradyrhizobium sp. 160]MCK1623296.1 hypothetical protein [Bradyrhizobium sp. 160]
MLRDGTRIETDEAIDLATIGVVYLAREYGEVSTGWTVIDIGANIGIFSSAPRGQAPRSSHTTLCPKITAG